MNLELTSEARDYLTSKLNEKEDKKVLELKQRWGITPKATYGFPIWTNQIISHGLFDGSKESSKTMNITWKGTLTTAKLSLHAVTPLFIEAELYVNGTKVGTKTGQAIWDTVIDVTGNINSGTNVFVFKTLKNLMIGWGDAVFTVSLTLESSEGGAGVSPMPFGIPSWVLYGFVGLLVVGTLLVVVRGRK